MMRATDFSLVPRIGQATYQFVGATSFGLRSFLESGNMMRRMTKRLKSSPGYCGHKVFYIFPLTMGTIAFFDSYNALKEFERSPEHRALRKWASIPGKTKGSFIRIYEALPQGNTTGMWVAQPDGTREDATVTGPAERVRETAVPVQDRA
jgi:hypothetical protein